MGLKTHLTDDSEHMLHTYVHERTKTSTLFSLADFVIFVKERWVAGQPVMQVVNRSPQDTDLMVTPDWPSRKREMNWGCICSTAPGRLISPDPTEGACNHKSFKKKQLIQKHLKPHHSYHIFTTRWCRCSITRSYSHSFSEEIRGAGFIFMRGRWTQTSHVIRRPDLVTPIFWVRPRDTCSTSVLSIGRRSGAEIPFPHVYTEDSGRECTFPEPKLIVPSGWGPDNSSQYWQREYFSHIFILAYNISECECLTSGSNCWNSSSWSSLTTSLHSGQWFFNSKY